MANEPQRAYLMHNGSRFFLCFGEDAVAASQGVFAYGENPDEIGVSQGVLIEPGVAYLVVDVYGSPLLKRACPKCHRVTSLDHYCDHCRQSSKATDSA